MSFVADVRLAGLLHDVGKLRRSPMPWSRSLPPLSDAEWLTDAIPPGARRRAAAERCGARRRARTDPLPPRAPGRQEAIRAAWSGEEIPLGARILAVADGYEAMTSERVYRRAPGSGAGARCGGAATGTSSTARWSRRSSRSGDGPAAACCASGGASRARTGDLWLPSSVSQLSYSPRKLEVARPFVSPPPGSSWSGPIADT